MLFTRREHILATLAALRGIVIEQAAKIRKRFS
jgi:hypothetical protein